MTSPSPRTTAWAPPSWRASSGYNVAWMPPNTTVAPRARAIPNRSREARCGVNANPNYVAGLDAVSIERLQRLVNDLWSAIRGRRCPCQHEQPARCNDADAERQMARVHKMDGHTLPFLIAPSPFAQYDGPGAASGASGSSPRKGLAGAP